MTYQPSDLADAVASLEFASIGDISGHTRQPRAVMAERLPEWMQPFLTWLTARPRSGEPVRELSPTYFVAVALVQTIAGVALSCLALHLPILPAALVLFAGLLLASSGLGLFQVVVFHHCSHGTVFKSRQTNIRVGRLISALLLFKHFDIYKSEHMLHHNHKKLLTEEDEFADFVFGMCGLEAALPKRELWRRVLVNLVSPAFHGRFLLRRVRAAWWSHDRLHNAVGISAWTALAGLAITTGHLPMLLVGWVLPVTVLLQVATVFRILCEHRFPEPEMILSRGKDFASHATAGVFPGSAPPQVSCRSVAGAARWLAWWADMLTVQLFVRLFVLVGDAPCHDFHHRRPASRRWTSYIQARQADLDAGAPGFRTHYQESWGLFRAVDENLASLSRTPRGWWDRGPWLHPPQPPLTETPPPAGRVAQGRVGSAVRAFARYQTRWRLLSAAASVPSSSTSSAPPIGTPCPTRVSATPDGDRRSASQCEVAAPSTVAPRARITSRTPPSSSRASKGATLRSSGPLPASGESVPPST